jgi:predicted metal-dependent enzyme (double-stranded beta helix superfamily)
MSSGDPENLSRRALLLTGAALPCANLVRANPSSAHARRKFDTARFVEECRAAASAGPDAQAAIRDVLAREMADCDAVLAGLGAPAKGGLKALYQSRDLTILNIVWSPLMQLLPHEHNMWALIGIYTGREDNVFWRRRPGQPLEATTAKAISAGEVVSLASDVIHSVNNPIEKLTGAIHVYGGDFFGVHRSEWDPETLSERDWSIREAVRNFEQSNARFFNPGCKASPPSNPG